MSLHLYNTRTKAVEPLVPLEDNHVRIYSCGPTVYDYVHIGNLSAFITADILRRVVCANGLEVTHVMNFTDVDDKTIERSQKQYPELEPFKALMKLTEQYSNFFLDDLQAVGADIDSISFIKATAPSTIEAMKEFIQQLYEKGFAYIADDGVYFSIDTYRKSGKTYGQLVDIDAANTSSHRIQNDEYDKEQAHDFALWKKQKPGEPAWDFMLDSQNITGRPGWHLECSVMSKQGLGQPFDIHTGGIDLAFPHHENEIAQSTAGEDSPIYASMFVHNEHILVDGRKMSKSLGNFYTLKDLKDQDVPTDAFRLLVLQSHYRKQTNFSFDNLEAASHRLKNWRRTASLRHQLHSTIEHRSEASIPSLAAIAKLTEILNEDLNTPQALVHIDRVVTQIQETALTSLNRAALVDFLQHVDSSLGLDLLASTPDISDEQKKLLLERRRAREVKDWQASDRIRDELLRQDITVRDTAHATIWERT